MAVSTATADVALVVGRVLFGGVLAFMGLNHFLQADDMAGYAASKGVPAAKAGVLLSGLLLVLGGLGLVLGAFPVLAALALVAFFVVTTPMMHDFWRQEGEMQQNELVNFLKNTALLGAALAFIAFTRASWAFSLNLGL